ncbi:hypothetical protein NL676_034682 [Syzygium grande]|nr:hypothetical protein NL676_034682 [Syzygium grande]
MESSCKSLDSVSSLLSIFASLLTITAFVLRFLHARDLDTHAQDPAPELPGRQEGSSRGGRAEGGGGEGQDDDGGHEQGAADPEPEEQGEGGGELLEVPKARAERNEKYGGPREECELNGVAVEEEEEMVIFASRLDAQDGVNDAKESGHDA